MKLKKFQQCSGLFFSYNYTYKVCLKTVEGKFLMK